MRALGLVGAIAIAAGVGSYYVTGEFGRFGQVNVVLGALALALYAVGALGRMRRLGGTPVARRMLVTRAALLVAVVAAAVALERGAARLDLRWDWTLDRRHELSPASRDALAALPDGLVATLYYDAEDPRIRGSRLLLQSFAATGRLQVRERVLDDAPEDIDRFGISSSNSVLLEVGDRWELVGRPSEGTLWEALERLRARERRAVVYYARGAGEGDLLRGGALGFSGLAAALQTEGYVVRDLVMAAADSIPQDAAALLAIAPERPWRDESVALVDRYLAAGGGLVALLDPGLETGLEPLLERWGFETPDAVVVDPASGPIEGGAPGVNPLAHAYDRDHPITKPLDANRMAFFLGARPVRAAHKPEPEDRLSVLVHSSPRAWLSHDFERIARGLPPEDRDGTLDDRYPLASAGRYPRGEREARVVVFGDSRFASNGHLRALFNLDLILNSVNWVAQRSEGRLTRRPNILTEIQQPLTPQESLSMFYGVGLLIPELLLMAAAITWLRQRSG